jgi:hypothetical protein
MRRSCSALVRDLNLPVPTAPEKMIASLCERMGERLGQPVLHRLVRFPPDTVSGVWVATDTANYVLCEQDTSSWHQLAITGHEFWHMEAEHHPVAVGQDDASGMTFPSLGAETVTRILAARSHPCEEAEQEAEVFASLLLARVSRWLPDRAWAVPDHAAGVVHRLETSLGRLPDRHRRG